MSDPHTTYEIRCPVHGFIPFDDWEKEIINHRVFQRLRRIRQLAWTDQVYPGAMHTRFEHSLGVMHTATLLYSAIRNASADVLQNDTVSKQRISLLFLMEARVQNSDFSGAISSTGRWTPIEWTTSYGIHSTQEC